MNRQVQMLNGPIECGLRILVILFYAYPECLDISRIVLFDYLVLHSGDFPEGPDSLHPPSPLRTVEVTARRALIETGVNLYLARGLICRLTGQGGISFSASDESATFLGALRSSYVDKLRQRAAWAVQRFGRVQSDEIRKSINGVSSKWGPEFALLSSGDG